MNMMGELIPQVFTTLATPLMLIGLFSYPSFSLRRPHLPRHHGPTLAPDRALLAHLPRLLRPLRPGLGSDQCVLLPSALRLVLTELGKKQFLAYGTYLKHNDTRLKFINEFVQAIRIIKVSTPFSLILSH